MSQIRVALLGYGLGGRVFHAPLLSTIPEFQLVTVASSRREEIRAAYPDVEVIADPIAAIQSADLVIISTPDSTHTTLVQAALEARKHVVVDKPFTPTLAEARYLVALAEQQGKLLSVYQNRRWDSDYLGACEAITSGRIGRVTQFESRMDRFRPLVNPEVWREAQTPIAGLWFDLAPHLADQARLLFGIPERIALFSATMRPNARREDWFHAVLQYPDVQVTLHSSMLVAGDMPRFAIHGTEGSWIKFGQDIQEAQTVNGMARTDPAFGVDPRGGVLWKNGEQYAAPVPRGDHATYYRLLRDALFHGAPNPSSPAEAVENMAILEAGVESLRTGRSVSL